MRRIHLALALIAFAISGLSHASDPKKMRVLVLIGYSDQHESFAQKLGLGSYPYYPDRARATESFLEMKLKRRGLHKTQATDWLRRFESSETQVDLINTNFPCPGEENAPIVMRHYRSECPRQRYASREAKAYVQTNALYYDAFFYIGHARYGSGLPFGNFADQNQQLDLRELTYGYIQKDLLALKLIVLGSCDSMTYYVDDLDSLKRRAPKFMGFSERQDWMSEILPQTARALDGLLSQGSVSIDLLPTRTDLSAEIQD